MTFEKSNSIDVLKIQPQWEKRDARLFGQKTEAKKSEFLKSDQEKIESEREAKKILWYMDGPWKKEKAREITEKWEKIDPKIIEKLLADIPPEKRKIIDRVKSYLWVNQKTSPDKVAQFHTSAGKNGCGPETAWCMSFVQHVLKELGNPNYRPTAWAQDGLKMGTPTQKPQPGDLLIVQRGEGGHIGFFLGFAPSGNPIIIGGNQGEQWEVSVKEEIRQILWYRNIA